MAFYIAQSRGFTSLCLLLFSLPSTADFHASCPIVPFVMHHLTCETTLFSFSSACPFPCPVSLPSQVSSSLCPIPFSVLLSLSYSLTFILTRQLRAIHLLYCPSVHLNNLYIFLLIKKETPFVIFVYCRICHIVKIPHDLII